MTSISNKIAHSANYEFSSQSHDSTSSGDVSQSLADILDIVARNREENNGSIDFDLVNKYGDFLWANSDEEQLRRTVLDDNFTGRNFRGKFEFVNAYIRENGDAIKATIERFPALKRSVVATGVKFDWD